MTIIHESSFSVGDEVVRKFDKNYRIGTITKLRGDVATVEFPSSERLPGRIDTYYISDLDKVKNRG